MYIYRMQCRQCLHFDGALYAFDGTLYTFDGALYAFDEAPTDQVVLEDALI